eukprot:1200702-Rhodomonas_salina.1
MGLNQSNYPILPRQDPNGPSLNTLGFRVLRLRSSSVPGNCGRGLRRSAGDELAWQQQTMSIAVLA